MGSGCIEPRLLDLGTSWRRVVSFTPRPLYSGGKSPQYQLDRRLGGPHCRSGHGEVNILAPPRLKIRFLGRPARSQSLYRPSYARFPIRGRSKNISLRHSILASDFNDSVSTFCEAGKTRLQQSANS
jgi:hypothetical protein